MIDVNNCDLITLFTFRYALDKPDGVHNLERDILDLQSFPERLSDSYLAEWQTYIKRQLHEKQRAPEQKKEFIKFLSDLEQGNNATFNKLCDVINTAVKVNNSPEVTVMTTPLKSYINQLLKI